MANNIIELENRPEHISQLKAVRRLYTKAGYYSTAYIIFCVLIPIIISIGRIFFHSVAPIVLHILMAYSLVALIVGFILESQNSKCRKIAAKIQQLFDSKVFGLEWDTHLWGEKPSLEDVNDNIGNLPDEEFVDWYNPQIEDLNQIEAILICQRTNLVYDSKLRKRYNSIIDGIAWSFLIIILFVAFYKNEGIQTAIVFVGVPLVPIIKWFLATRKQNLEDINRCETLKSFIDDCLEKIKKNPIAINECTLYRIQDGIYRHRKVAFKIPDFLYNYMRNNQEKNIDVMVNQLAHK